MKRHINYLLTCLFIVLLIAIGFCACSDTESDDQATSDGDVESEMDADLFDADLDGDLEVDELEVEIIAPMLTPLSPEKLQQDMENKDFLLINVHVPYAGHILKTDTQISYLEPENIITYIGDNLDQKVVVYCLTNHMALISGNDLLDSGYRNVFYLDGGMMAWTNDEYQLEYQ